MSGFSIPIPGNAPPTAANVAELVRLRISQMPLDAGAKKIFDGLPPERQVEAYRTMFPREYQRLLSGSFGKMTGLPVPDQTAVAEAVVNQLPTAGALVGGLAGAETGPGAIGTAALGAAGGEALRQIVSRLAGLPAPQSAGGAAKGILEQGALGGATEGGARLAGYALRPLTGFIGTLGPRSAEDAALKAMAEKEGWRLPAYAIPGSGRAAALARGLAGIGEASLFGAPEVRVAREEGGQAMVASLEKWLGSLGGVQGGPEARGDVIQQAIQGARDNFGRLASQYYDTVDRMAAGNRVNLRAAKAEARAMVARSGQKEFPLTGGVSAAVEDIANAPDDVPFATAAAMRSKYQAASRGEGIFGGRETGETKRMGQLLDSAIDASGRSLKSRAAVAAFRKANSFYAGGAEIFDSSTIGLLMRKDPELVANLIRGADVSAARRIRSAIEGVYKTPYGTVRLAKLAKNAAAGGRAETALRSFQEEWLRSAILHDPSGVRGEAGMMDLRGIKKRLLSYNPGVLEAIFDTPQSREVLKNVRMLGEASSRLATDISGHSARQSEMVRVLISLGMADAKGAAAGAGTLTVLETGPALITKVLYSPRATRWLTSSFNLLRAGNLGRAVAAAGRAFAIAEGISQHRPETIAFPGVPLRIVKQ